MWVRLGARGATEVDVDGDPPGRVLVDALVDAGLVAAAARRQLCIARSGTALDVETSLSDLGLRNGDRLTTQPRTAPRDGSPGPLLSVGMGPGAGITVPLRDGLTVGREAELSVDDPGLSREHLRFTRDGESVQAEDLGSLNGSFLLGRRLDSPTAVPPGAPVEAASSVFRVEATAPAGAPVLVVRDGLAQFNRPPRIAAPALGRRHAIPAPPEARPPRRIPLLTALAPLVIAPFFLATSGGIAFVAILLMSPLIAFASYWEDRRHGGKDQRTAEARFRGAVESARRQLLEDLPREAVRRWAAAPDVVEVLRRAQGPAADLWERRPTDADWLRLRVGWTDLPSASGYDIGDGGQDELRAEAAGALDPLLVCRGAPLTVDLPAVGALGLHGAPDQTAGLARWLVAQLATLHSPRDLRLAAAVADDTGWSWFPHLPHCSGPEGALFAADPAGARRVVSAVTTLVEQRRGASTGLGEPGPTAPALVLLVDERAGLPRNALTTVLEDGPAVGVHVCWLSVHRTSVPGQCRAIVAVGTPTVGVTWTDTGRTVEEASLDIAPDGVVETVAWHLAGIADSSSRDRAGDVPATASYVQVLGIEEPSADDVLRRWSASRGLVAPVGLGSAGPVHLDLRHDGPHALVGGTTGAGKSELLQTVVAALAASVPPERLTFLLVDYKGGAAFKDCVSLPHTVGFVTDLDGHLVRRVLVSLGAELEHRERALAGAGARDLVEMERIAPGSAPPALAVVVDEFAALATELPEFVDGVVNLAQRGRSLGMHLVLATQRPAGVINDQIRANTNLRISLRMNDVADSQDVIDSAVAAHLPRTLPGRAFMRTGSAELTEFQTGFGGGTSFGGGAGRPQVAVRGARRSPGGGASPPRTGPPPADAPTDLQRLVHAVTAAHAASGRPAPRLPWLPPLPDVLPADGLPAASGTAVAIGLRDEPDSQAQPPHVVDLAQGGLLAAGAPGSGKTTLLRTLATRLAQQNAPADLHLYALDFASRGLRALEQLPHCGSVVPGDDVERALRLLTTLGRWQAQRRDLLAAAAVSSLEELRRHQAAAGEPPTPRVVVLLDGWSAFAQAFEKVDYGSWLERLPLLVAEGRSVGVHWAVTADRRLSTSTALISALPQRLVLRQGDADDYEHFGLDRRRTAQATLPPGRAFDVGTSEVHVAVIGDDPSGQAQIAALEAVAAELRTEHGTPAVPGISLLPRSVRAATLPAHVGPRAVLGLDDTDLAPALVDLDDGHFLVAGPPRSGKSTALGTLARSLRAAHPTARLVLVAPRRTPLTALDVWDERIGADEDAIDDLLDRVVMRSPDDPALVVVVDDAQELVDGLSDTTLDTLARRGRDLGVHLLVACDRSVAHRSYGGVVQRVRADRSGLLLQPDPDADGDLLGAALERRWAGGPVGRGALVVAGTSSRVQVASWDDLR